MRSKSKRFVSLVLICTMLFSITSNVFASGDITEDFEFWGFFESASVSTGGSFLHGNWRFESRSNGSASGPDAIETTTYPAALSLSQNADEVDDFRILTVDGSEFDFSGFNFSCYSYPGSMTVSGWRDGVQVTGTVTANYSSGSYDVFYNMRSPQPEFKNVDEVRMVGVDQVGDDSIHGILESFTYNMIPVDTTAPTVTITSTAASVTNTSPIPVTITFSEAVTGFTADDITVTNGSLGTLSGSGTVYTVNVTPTAQGAVKVNVAAGLAIDGAGNSNTAAVQLSRTYDTTAPTVTLTSTPPNPTNVFPIPVMITFSEAVTGFTAGDITVTNGTVDTLSGSGSTYTLLVTPTAQGAVKVDIAAGIAIDSAGNSNTAAAQLSRTFDTVSPAVTISSTAASVTNNSPIPVTITFSKAVTGFTTGDITVTNGSLGTLSGSGSTYTINVTPASEGTVTVNVAAGLAIDSAGNSNTAATQLSRTYDNGAPSVTITSTAASVTNTSPIPVTITFS